MLADPTTPDALRESLVLVDDARALASRLGLEVGERYRSYAPWPGDRVVTIVVATRPGEVEPAGFWFPVVGRVPYKGFFDPTRAEAEAQRLAEAGQDTCVVPVSAYSTLGWFDDPVTQPMLRAGPGRLVETLIHELVHATIFAPSQPEFNEGIASFVGQEASVRFFTERDGPGSERAQEARRRVDDDRAIAGVRLALRERVSELYHDEPAGAMRHQDRARLEARSREALAALPLTTRDPATLSREARLNDACLSLAGTYAADLERYALRLEALGGDLAGLVEAARAASEAPDPRAALLGPP